MGRRAVVISVNAREFYPRGGGGLVYYDSGRYSTTFSLTWLLTSLAVLNIVLIYSLMLRDSAILRHSVTETLKNVAEFVDLSASKEETHLMFEVCIFFLVSLRWEEKASSC